MGGAAEASEDRLQRERSGGLEQGSDDFEQMALTTALLLFEPGKARALGCFRDQLGGRAHGNE